MIKNLNFFAVANQHPCFRHDINKNANKGRIHLPVSPSCNIQCAFCSRVFNNEENRPGVASRILSPKEAAALVDKALELCPQITVAGIAGPGDTLATHHAIDTFKILQETHPQLINCLSTNGLMLEKYAQELSDVGVKTITVTVNAVDPEILKDICLWVIKDGEKISGVEGAKILIDAQKKGIKKIAELGALVKINTVLIPDVNENHINEIAREMRELGAHFINIIPLIPQHKFSHLNAPTCEQLHAARESAEKFLKVFRHCQHCRADACGIPGKNDFADELYLTRTEATFSHG